MSFRRSALGRAGVRVSLLVLAGLVLQACGQAGGSVSVTGACSSAAQLSSSSDCIAISLNVDPFPTNAADRATMSAVVLEATYLGLAGPAVWNTPDGKRPSAASVGTQLNTPASLAGIVTFRSSLGAGALLIPGGMNGCDSEVYSNAYLSRPTEGSRYLFFLVPARDTSGRLLDGGILEDAWPVAADGTIGAPNARMTEDGLRALLVAHPYRPAGAAAPSGRLDPPTAAASLPPSSISPSAAEALARQDVRTSAVLVSVNAGRFADVYVPPPNHSISPANPVHPDDLVWVVTFSGEFSICPPDGSPCSSPRPGITTVILDYVTGTFLESSGSAPAP